MRAWYHSATGGGMRDANSVSETSAFRNFLGKRTSVAFLSLFIISEWSDTCCFRFLLRGIFTSFGCDADDLSRAGLVASRPLCSRGRGRKRSRTREVCAADLSHHTRAPSPPHSRCLARFIPSRPPSSPPSAPVGWSGPLFMIGRGGHAGLCTR